MRRMLATGSALLGVSTFLHAIAPQVVPPIVAALTGGWITLTLALVGIGVDELLVRHERARLSRRP